jgi:hypothetical protein
MSFLAWIVLGLISGFIASKIVNKLALQRHRPYWCDWRKSLQHSSRGSRGSHRSVHLSRIGGQSRPRVSRRAISRQGETSAKFDLAVSSSC